MIMLRKTYKSAIQLGSFSGLVYNFHLCKVTLLPTEWNMCRGDELLIQTPERACQTEPLGAERGALPAPRPCNCPVKSH